METTDFDFGQIAGRYDLCNHLFSMGIDRLWRRAAAGQIGLQAGSKALDLCCGTGDLTFALARYTPATEIVGLDISPAMIARAKEKQKRLEKKTPSLAGRIQWKVADALQTGLPEETFDGITCAFGLRNIPDRPAALREIHRLLRPGGRAVILEFSLPQNILLRGLYRVYLRMVMPAAGILLFRSREPLFYLARSIQQWNDEFDLLASCRRAGLDSLAAQPLTGGIVTLHRLKRSK